MPSKTDPTTKSIEKATTKPTLRDRFAMAALTGFVADGSKGDVVSRSWEIADRMMEFRSR